jgi:hypothetical protein
MERAETTGDMLLMRCPALSPPGQKAGKPREQVERRLLFFHQTALCWYFSSDEAQKAPVRHRLLIILAICLSGSCPLSFQGRSIGYTESPQAHPSAPRPKPSKICTRLSNSSFFILSILWNGNSGNRDKRLSGPAVAPILKSPYFAGQQIVLENVRGRRRFCRKVVETRGIPEASAQYLSAAGASSASSAFEALRSGSSYGI